MKTEKLFKVLASIHALPEDFKEALKKELHFVAYPKGHYLVQARSPAMHAYFLKKGFSVSFQYREYKRVVTDFWQAGDIILSPKSFFEQSPSDEIIQLTTDSELLSISYEAVSKLFENFAVANFLARSITADYHARSEERIVDLHSLGAWKRYTKLLEMYPGIEIHVSQDLIASYLNITPQSLSRLKGEHN